VIVNFVGPIVFCVISRYHGGAFVVFSKALNLNMTGLAWKARSRGGAEKRGLSGTGAGWLSLDHLTGYPISGRTAFAVCVGPRSCRCHLPTPLSFLCMDWSERM